MNGAGASTIRAATLLCCIHAAATVSPAASDPPPETIAVLPTDPSGRTFAIARWAEPTRHEDAVALAQDLGAVVALPAGPEARHRWRCFRGLPTLELGPCDGPWIDAIRAPAPRGAREPWRRTDGTPIPTPPWSEGRPAASDRLPAAATLDPEGRWRDTMPTPAGGGTSRAVALVWTAAADDDLDGIPDALEEAIGRLDLETIDADLDGDGVVDGCSRFGDLDGSGRIDAGDLAAMLAGWGETGHPADLDGDGIVDAGDLALLLSAWD